MSPLSTIQSLMCKTRDPHTPLANPTSPLPHQRPPRPPRPRAASRASVASSHAAIARGPVANAREPCRPRAPHPMFPPSDRPAPRACITARWRGCPHSAARPIRAQKCAASSPCEVVPTRIMLHKLVPQLRVPRCGRICRARREPGALTSALQCCAAPRRARRASVGEVAAAVEAVLVRVRDEGTRRSEWTRGGG